MECNDENIEKMDEDEDLLLSLGAKTVDAGQFEQNLMTQLEEQFNKVDEPNIADTDTQENENDGDATLNKCNINNEDSNDASKVERPNEKINSYSSGSSILRQVLESKKAGSSKTATNKNNAVTPSSKSNSVIKNKKISSSPKVLLSQEPTDEVESEKDRQIRIGLMTPFGAVIERTPTTPKASFLDFTTYLNSQKAFEKNWGKDNNKKKSKPKPQKRPESDSEEQVVRIKRSRTSAPKSSNSKPSKSSETKALKYNVMFPKKKRPKVPLGSKTGANDGQKPGTSKAETTSMYLNPEEDSDYVPPQDSDDDWQPDKITKRPESDRRKQKTKRKVSYQEPNSDSDFSEDDTVKAPKRMRKEADDGDFKYYQQRIQEWKANEVRFTGKFHEIEGGFKVPKHVWDSLYDYQKVGVNWLWELHQKNCGGILGDEMGLGKTIQMIAFLAGVSCSNLLFRFSKWRGLGPTIIVCPATVMHQWVKEFHTWWPPFRVVILHESGSYSGSKSKIIRSVVANNGILITSYVGVVHSQAEILNHSWHYVILDEGHKIRNPDAQVTLAVKQIPTPHRIICSGSPLQNNLKELWSLFDFVFPGKLATLPTFMEQFAVPITQGGYANASDIQVATAFKCATTLRNIIAPYLLRRLKADVKSHLNLPPKSEQVLFCKLTPEQKSSYINYINSKEIDSIIQGRFNLFVGLINLRKICNHPHLFDGGPKLISNSKKIKKQRVPKVKAHMMSEAAADSSLPSSYHSLNPEVSEEEGEISDSDIELDPDDSFGHWSKSGKMVVLETLLKLWHRQSHKVLLFSQSRQMLCILENFVKQRNYNYLRLDGCTSIGARQPLIKKFNEDPSIFIFILTTKVGGLGVNLTGANRVVIFDPDWNPSTDLQARERAWRIGQDKQVTIYRLITSGTIEEKIYHRQIFKQFLANRILKDPKQKRLFKSNDMLELFSFNEGTENGNETQAIFAGTGSDVNVRDLKRKRKPSSSSSRKRHRRDSQQQESSDTEMRPTEEDKVPIEEPREKSSGKFRGVPNLVKQRKQVHDDKAKDEEGEQASNDQDDYVLRKLFRKSGVEAAIKHDKVLDNNEQDYLLVEKEAERVAADAVKVLNRAREQCWSAESGRANWTGSSGGLREAPAPKRKPRFGPKKPEAVSKAPPPPSVPEEENFFGGTNTMSNDVDESIPSSDLIAAIKARKRSILPTEGQSNDTNNNNDNNPNGARPAEDLDHVNPVHVELLRDIREFMAFKAAVDGQASTNELLAEFGTKLPPKDSALFKALLHQLCTFRRVEGQGIWRLKLEFR